MIISPINFTGLWRNLPYTENVSYVYVDDNNGDIDLTLDAVVVTPLSKDEEEPSNAKYIKQVTTFKIPEEVWISATTFSIPDDPALPPLTTDTPGNCDGGNYVYTVRTFGVVGNTNVIGNNPVSQGVALGSFGQTAVGTISLDISASSSQTHITRSFYNGTDIVVSYRLSGNGNFIDTNSGWSSTDVSAVQNNTTLPIEPKSKDRITVEGLEWTVDKQVDGTRNHSPYRLSANRMVITLAFNDKITIYAPTNTTDSSTLPSVALNALYIDQVCAIEPTTPKFMEREKFQDKQGYIERFDCYLQVEIDSPVAGFTVVDQNNVTYMVTGWRKQERIDSLMILELELRP